MERLIELYKKSKDTGLHLGEFHEAIELLQLEIKKLYDIPVKKKVCLGCKTSYDGGVWLDPVLKLCSKCYHIHMHSEIQEWDKDMKAWVKKEKKKGIETWI